MRGPISENPLDPCRERATDSRFPGLSERGAKWIAVNDTTVPVGLYLNGIQGPDLGPGTPILLNDLLDLEIPNQNLLVLKAYGYDPSLSDSAGIEGSSEWKRYRRSDLVYCQGFSRPRVEGGTVISSLTRNVSVPILDLPIDPCPGSNPL